MNDSLLLLRRDTIVDVHTMGELLVRDEHFCWTLEDPIRERVGINGWYWDSSFKIPKQTAIPSGVYEVAVTFSGKFQRRMPILLGVPDYTGIRFHTGETVDHSEGCPLIGRSRNQDQGRLWGGEGLTAELTAIIDGASKQGKVWCKVANP